MQLKTEAKYTSRDRNIIISYSPGLNFACQLLHALFFFEGVYIYTLVQ